jgi:hypothetical protein
LGAVVDEAEEAIDEDDKVDEEEGVNDELLALGHFRGDEAHHLQEGRIVAVSPPDGGSPCQDGKLLVVCHYNFYKISAKPRLKSSYNNGFIGAFLSQRRETGFIRFVF